jgi:ABC-2 type transport system permease protein
MGDLRTAVNRNLQAMWGRAYVRVVGVNREMSWVIFDVFFPLFSIAAYVLVYQAVVLDPTIRQAMMIRVILGGAMIAFWTNVLWGMGANFYFEKESGNLQLYMMAPISRIAILFGMAVGGMFNTTVRAISTILLGSVIFGISFVITAPVELTLVFILTLASLYGMGMLFASMFLMWGREAWHTANLFQEPVFFFSGFYFPVRALGYTVALGAGIIPITLGLDAMNQILGGSFARNPLYFILPVNYEIIGLLLLTILYFVLAHYTLRFMENMAKREGRRTLQQQ